MAIKLPVEEKLRRAKLRGLNYYAKNREIRKRRASEYYYKNRELILAKEKAKARWRTPEAKAVERRRLAKNQDKIREYRRAYYTKVYRPIMIDRYHNQKKDPSLEAKRTEKKVYLSEYYKRNKAKIQSNYKRWINADPGRLEADKLRRQLFYRQNKQYCIARHNEWRKANKEACTIATTKRRMKVKGLIHPQSNAKTIVTLYLFAKSESVRTGIKQHVDHVIPVAVGGWHHESNLQILPRSVNSIKRDDPFWTMAGYKSWRDVPEFLWPVSVAEKYQSIRSKESLKSA